MIEALLFRSDRYQRFQSMQLEGKMSEEINIPRRRFLGSAAMAIAVAKLATIGSAHYNRARQERQVRPRSSRARAHRLALSSKLKPVF